MNDDSRGRTAGYERYEAGWPTWRPDQLADPPPEPTSWWQENGVMVALAALGFGLVLSYATAQMLALRLAEAGL